jgi:hypothetical protein
MAAERLQSLFGEHLAHLRDAHDVPIEQLTTDDMIAEELMAWESECNDCADLLDRSIVLCDDCRSNGPLHCPHHSPSARARRRDD